MNKSQNFELLMTEPAFWYLLMEPFYDKAFSCSYTVSKFSFILIWKTTFQSFYCNTFPSTCTDYTSCRISEPFLCSFTWCDGIHGETSFSWTSTGCPRTLLSWGHTNRGGARESFLGWHGNQTGCHVFLHSCRCYTQ